jgi:hypothetical protein
VELYAAPLSNSGNPRRETARKPGENKFYRSRSIVFGREELRVIRLDRKHLATRLFGSESKEAAYRRAAVRAIYPFAARAPLELSRFRRLLKCCAGTHKRIDVNTVIHDCACRVRHFAFSYLLKPLSKLCWARLCPF